MSAVRALNGDEWRRLRLARMAAVEAMPYFARALFALSPVAAPGLKTAAVDRYWRLYIDPAMLGTDEGWSIPLAGAVLLHEVAHVLREHGSRSDALDSPVDRLMWNLAADAEINDDLIAAGLVLPDGAVTPSGFGCQDGHAAEVYYRHLVPPGAPRSDPKDPGGEDDGCGCGSGAGDAPVPGELPAAADLGSGSGLSPAAADLVKVAVARAVQQELQSGGSGRGRMPAGIARWAARQLAPAVVPWPKVLRAAVRRAVEDQAGQVHHSWRRPNRRAPAGLLLPTLRAPKIAVDLIVDTSASMGDDDLGSALSETRGVLRQAGVRVRVLCCDAAATAPRVVRSISDVTLTGGGGTDLRVGIDAVLAARPAANVIVAFTDSQGISTLCGFRFIPRQIGPSSRGSASSQSLCFGSLIPALGRTYSLNVRCRKSTLLSPTRFYAPGRRVRFSGRCFRRGSSRPLPLPSAAADGISPAAGD